MDGWVIIGTDLETKNFEKQIAKLENDLDTLEQEYEVLKKSKPYENQVEDLKYYEAEIEKTKNKIIGLQKQQLNQGVNKELGNIGNSLENVVKKVGKWSLALFGIRSAYNLIRRSISTVSQYDEQIGADINYMSMALASILEPVVRRIVDLAHTLLVYVGYIIKAWTGQNIFKNANKYLQKSVGSAKQLRRELAGFDEMNVLNDSSSGSGSSAVLPSFNLANPEDVPIPSWIKWIADHKDEVIAGLGGMAGGLGLINPKLKDLKKLGIALALDGIIGSLGAITKFLKSPTFSNFLNIILRIGEAVVGLGLVFGSLPLIIAGVVAIVMGLILKNYDKIVGLFESAISWLQGPFRNKMRELFGPIGDIITDVILAVVNYGKTLFEGWFGGIKKIIDGVIKIFKGDFKGGIIEVFSGIKSIMLAPINALISALNTLISGINRVKIKAPSWLPLIGGKEWSINIPKIPRLAKGGIINMPGRGVNYGGANIGEQRMEGVIPLTDSQQMALLGEAIGKYITINANITNTMNGRVISRELQKVQNDSNFAFNR